MDGQDELQKRYLDLMKKTLSFSLWQEPPIPLDQFNPRRGFPLMLRAAINAVVRVMRYGGLQIAITWPRDEEAKAEGRFWPVLADTMIGMKRLDNLQFCVETVIRDNIPGDLIETGVWRGGACILMRAVLMAHGVCNKRIFVADSFKGLPKPDEEKYPRDKGDKFFTFSYLAVPREEVERNFSKYGLLDEQVVFLEGWFRDTLPSSPIEKLSVLRLDGDMYQSTIEVLTHLYPKLSQGGFCIIDDYALQNCRQAVADYRNMHGITDLIHPIDSRGAFWRNEL